MENTNNPNPTNIFIFHLSVNWHKAAGGLLSAPGIEVDMLWPFTRITPLVSDILYVSSPESWNLHNNDIGETCCWSPDSLCLYAQKIIYLHHQ